MALIFCFLMQIWMVEDLRSSLKILYNKQILLNEWNFLSKLNCKTSYEFLHRCYLIFYVNLIDVKRNVNNFTIFPKPIDIPSRSQNVLTRRRYTYFIHFIALLRSHYRSKWLTIAGNICSILSHVMLYTVMLQVEKVNYVGTDRFLSHQTFIKTNRYTLQKYGMPS